VGEIGLPLPEDHPWGGRHGRREQPCAYVGAALGGDLVEVEAASVADCEGGQGWPGKQTGAGREDGRTSKGSRPKGGTRFALGRFPLQREIQACGRQGWSGGCSGTTLGSGVLFLRGNPTRGNVLVVLCGRIDQTLVSGGGILDGSDCFNDHHQSALSVKLPTPI
jgi:hypothetical protein